MHRDFHKIIAAILLAILITGVSEAGVRKTRWRNRFIPDTIPQRGMVQETMPTRRMSTSLYPVQIQVTGSAVRVQSEHSQLLPIYTRSGSFYMTMRLNKGTNWLTGLPRGHYFINNRPITIN